MKWTAWLERFGDGRCPDFGVGGEARDVRFLEWPELHLLREREGDDATFHYQRGRTRYFIGADGRDVVVSLTDADMNEVRSGEICLAGDRDGSLVLTVANGQLPGMWSVRRSGRGLGNAVALGPASVDEREVACTVTVDGDVHGSAMVVGGVSGTVAQLSRGAGHVLDYSLGGATVDARVGRGTVVSVEEPLVDEWEGAGVDLVGILGRGGMVRTGPEALEAVNFVMERGRTTQVPVCLSRVLGSLLQARWPAHGAIPMQAVEAAVDVGRNVDAERRQLDEIGQVVVDELGPSGLLDDPPPDDSHDPLSETKVPKARRVMGEAGRAFMAAMDSAGDGSEGVLMAAALGRDAVAAVSRYRELAGGPKFDWRATFERVAQAGYPERALGR